MGDLTTGLASAPRLVAAAWSLVRADALAPREIEPLLPAWAKLTTGFLRLFAGREARSGRPGERLARVLERQGPVAIKLGQFLSTRADIFGGEFTEDLARLKDRLPPFPTTVAAAEVERALGGRLPTLFTDFQGAVGAASLAQVHAAVLADGRRVAVKVLRPGIEGRVEADVSALTLAARLTDAIVPAARRLEPQAFAATIARALRLELDLRFEAAGADELREVMSFDSYMTAPRVIWEGVARRVLTLEWVEGDALSGGDVLDRPELDRPRLATDLIRAFLTQAMDHGVFHADLHEGNLFVDHAGRLVAVDFGIVGRLGARERRFLAEVLWGFLTRDYARVAAVHAEAGYLPSGHDLGAFAQALRAVGEPIFGRAAADVSMNRLLAQLFEITALFDMRLRPELVLLQKTMVTVEGVARRIDPRLDIWAAAEPVVRRWIGRELSPASRLKELGDQALGVMARLAAERAVAPPPVVVVRGGFEGLGFALGVLSAALAFAGAWLLR